MGALRWDRRFVTRAIVARLITEVEKDPGTDR